VLSSRSSFIARSAALVAALTIPSSRVFAQTAALTTVKVGAFPIDTMGVVFYAQELGYFQNVGLDIHFTDFAGGPGPQMATAIVAGALDIAVSNISTLASAHLRGIDFKYIAPSAISTPKTRTDLIMVANDSTISKAADLNGKTIAIVNVKGLQQVTAMAWVDKHGGDSKTLTFVELPFPQMAASLKERRVDAISPTEPFVTAAHDVARPLGNVLDGIAGEFMILGFFSSDAWLATHADTATRFASALRRAAIWANDHQKESATILLKYSKLDPGTAATMARATYGVELSTADLQPVIDASAQYKAIDKPFPATELLWRAPR
jgi:NitT/TauT family transport system substrate-binding protein